jgi:hypothetical protein|nr:MAG TPA: hypothetical protein [Caudoviricetes sp.]
MIKYQVYTAKDKQVILPEGEITKVIWDNKKSELDTYRTTQTNKILTDLRARTKKDSKNDHRAIFMDLANGVIIWARLLAGDTLTNPKVATEYFYLRTPAGNTEVNFTELFSKWEIPNGNEEVDKVIKALFEKYKELQKAELAGKTIDQVALKDELVKLIKKYVDAKIAEIPTIGGTPAPVNKETIINLLKEAVDPDHPDAGSVLIALLTEHLLSSSAGMATLLADENGSKPFKYFLKLNNLYGAAADINMFKEMYDTTSPNIVCGVNKHGEALVQNLDILDLNTEGKDSDTPLTPTEIFVDKENTVTKNLPPKYSLMVYRSVKYAKEVRPSGVETEEHYINGKGQPEDTYVPNKVRTIGVENVLKHFADNVCPSLYLEKQANGEYVIGNQTTANLFKKYLVFYNSEGFIPYDKLPEKVTNTINTITEKVITVKPNGDVIIKKEVLDKSELPKTEVAKREWHTETIFTNPVGGVLRFADDSGIHLDFKITLTTTTKMSTFNIDKALAKRSGEVLEGIIIVHGAAYIMGWENEFKWREVPYDLRDVEVFAYTIEDENTIHIGRV